MSIETLDTAGVAAVRAATRHDGASEVRVDVADAGNGAAVSVRKWIVAPPIGSVVGEACKGRKGKSAYVGPTREGFWLQPSEAEEIAELLLIAAIAARMAQEREYGEAS